MEAYVHREGEVHYSQQAGADRITDLRHSIEGYLGVLEGVLTKALKTAPPTRAQWLEPTSPERWQHPIRDHNRGAGWTESDRTQAGQQGFCGCGQLSRAGPPDGPAEMPPRPADCASSQLELGCLRIQHPTPLSLSVRLDEKMRAPSPRGQPAQALRERRPGRLSRASR